MVLNEVSERVSGCNQPSRAKAAAALLVLNGWAAGAHDIARKRQATHVVSTREVINTSIARQLGAGSGTVYGTATIAEAADVVVGVGTAVNLPTDIARARRPIRIISTREVFITQGARQLGPGLSNVTGTAAIAESADLVLGVGTLTPTSADIFSGQDTIGWPAPLEIWAPAIRTSQVVLTLYINGTAAVLETADVVSGTGTQGYVGIAVITEGSDAVAGTGTQAATGTASITESADVVVAIGTAAGIGVAVITETADIVSGTGTQAVTGTAAILEALDVVAGTGTNANISGTASITEGIDVVVGIGAGVAAILESLDSVLGIGINQSPGKRFGLCTMTVAPSFTIIEDSACFVTVNFIDSDGNPFLPTSAQYRLDDVASDTQILGWTPVPITGTSVTITVTAAQNALLGRPLETHQCLVQLTDGLGNVDNVRTAWEICQVAGLMN